MKLIKVRPNDRLLVEQGARHKVAGPGWVWVFPWQRVITTFSIDARSETFEFREVRTKEHLPVNLMVRVSYQVEPALFTPQLLPKIPALSSQGWSSTVQWQTEHLLRQALADFSWADLGRFGPQEQLEHQLAQTMSNRLAAMALKVFGFHLIKTELPGKLQQTLVQAEQDTIEAGGRAKVLKDYFSTFGGQLNEAMPHILQWEAMNLLHKNGKSHLLLTNPSASPATLAGLDTGHPNLQVKLPVTPGENGHPNGSQEGK
jgi:regulator of protease activity HflC (stomatin/prohibitin superfamily)